MGKKVVKAMIAATGLVAMLGMSWVSDTKASGAEAQAAVVEPVALQSKSSSSAKPTLGAAAIQPSLFTFVPSVHVPEFIGTLMAFLVMAWALQTRRIV